MSKKNNKSKAKVKAAPVRSSRHDATPMFRRPFLILGGQTF
jgi:hypothetical protein